MAKQQLNIIIAGKSGVGKSSFLNYLIGDSKFETGNGEPVTQHYFQQESYTDSRDVTFTLFDTKGLEPGECQKSKEIIIDEVEKRDESEDMFEWIHSVYYCISAIGRRIEPFEINFIKDLKEKCSVVILLTKADKVESEVLNELKQTLYDDLSNDVQVISVCSVAERTRRGTSNQFGRGDVLRASFLGLWDKLALTLPKRLTSQLDGNTLCRTYKKEFAFTKGDYVKFATLTAGNSLIGGCLAAYLAFKQIKSNATSDDSSKFSLKGCEEPKNYVDILCSLSNMGLFIKDLYGKDRETIRNFMDNVNQILDFLRERFTELNVDNLWSKQEDIIKGVFAFYDRVNEKQDKRELFLHRAKYRLNLIKKFDWDSEVEDIRKKEKKVRKQLDNVDSCFIFDDDEKKSVITAWGDYRDEVVRLGYNFKELFFKFEATFEAELYQYGQYCIREY